VTGALARPGHRPASLVRGDNNTNSEGSLNPLDFAGAWVLFLLLVGAERVVRAPSDPRPD